jgi:MoxR-like ATPase
VDVMQHRIGLSYEAEAENMTAKKIVEAVINRVDVP